MRKKIKGLLAAVFAGALICQMPCMTVLAQAQTFGEKMQNAAFNTVLGMGTVFIMLIVMALVIFGFRIISVFQKKNPQKNEKEGQLSETKKSDIPAEAGASGNETDNLELAAVIAAAIASYEQVPMDSFVVRTIKKRW